jgi:Aspartyl protease
MRKPLLLLWLLLVAQNAIAQQAMALQTMFDNWSALWNLDLLLKEDPPSNSTVKSNHIPFHLNGGLIFFEAQFNGISDTFVLDTGSPCLLLNEQANTKSKNCYSAVGVSGSFYFEKKSGHTFQMGAEASTDVVSLSANLSHLEKVKKQCFRGMVGQELLAGFELFLDYKNKVMSLLKGGAAEEVKGYTRLQSISFDTQQHFVVLNVKIGRRTYKFGLDTGAEVNIIDNDVAKWLPAKYFQVTEKIKIRGVSPKGVGAEVGQVSTCNIAGQTINNMPFVVMDMSVLNEGNSVELDGLLGFPFLSSNLFSIDYVNELLHVWSSNEDVLVDLAD